jgi:hypothetical protein
MQFLLWKCPNLTREKKSNFFFRIGEVHRFSFIIVDKTNQTKSEKGCKEKETDIKHVILINGNAYELPSLKAE